MFGFLDKIADWIPGRRESLRSKKQELERKLSELQKSNFTTANAMLYEQYSRKLREINQKLGNS